MNLLGLFVFLCVSVAVALADPDENAKKMFEMALECRRKNDIPDDDPSTFLDNPSTNQKCALACVSKNFGVIKDVDGKPELSEEVIVEISKAMKVPDEKLAQSTEIVKICKAEAASITDECEYAYATATCMKREGDTHEIEFGIK